MVSSSYCELFYLSQTSEKARNMKFYSCRQLHNNAVSETEYREGSLNTMRKALNLSQLSKADNKLLQGYIYQYFK